MSRRSLSVFVCAAIAAASMIPAWAQKAPDKAASAGATLQEAPPGGFLSWDQLYGEQTRLNKVATQLYDVVRESGELDEGYAGLVAAPENREVWLYWHGPLPERIESALTAARAQVSVAVIPAAFSEQQMVAEAQRWMASGLVLTAGPKADGSGVAIRTAASAEHGALKLAEPTMPADVIYDDFLAETYNRQKDVPSYYGGGYYWNETRQGSCTTGFAVRPIWSGVESWYFLTAAHCGIYTDEIWDGNKIFAGFHWQSDSTRDIATIYLLRKSATGQLLPNWSAGRVFDGDWQSKFSSPVKYAERSFVGNFVQASGASTGELAGIQVTAVNQTVAASGGGQHKGMVFGKQQFSGVCASTYGNSGGPIHSIVGFGNPNIVAKGITSAMLGPYVSCPGKISTGGQVVIWVDIVDALYWMSMKLITN